MDNVMFDKSVYVFFSSPSASGKNILNCAQRFFLDGRYITESVWSLNMVIPELASYKDFQTTASKCISEFYQNAFDPCVKFLGFNQMGSFGDGLNIALLKCISLGMSVQISVEESSEECLYFRTSSTNECIEIENTSFTPISNTSFAMGNSTKPSLYECKENDQFDRDVFELIKLGFETPRIHVDLDTQNEGFPLYLHKVVIEKEGYDFTSLHFEFPKTFHTMECFVSSNMNVVCTEIIPQNDYKDFIRVFLYHNTAFVGNYTFFAGQSTVQGDLHVNITCDPAISFVAKSEQGRPLNFSALVEIIPRIQGFRSQDDIPEGCTYLMEKLFFNPCITRNRCFLRSDLFTLLDLFSHFYDGLNTSQRNENNSSVSSS